MLIYIERPSKFENENEYLFTLITKVRSFTSVDPFVGLHPLFGIKSLSNLNDYNNHKSNYGFRIMHYQYFLAVCAFVRFLSRMNPHMNF